MMSDNARQTRFQAGELVDVTIKGARVESVEADTNSLTVFYRVGATATVLDAATLMLGGAVQVTRRAPKEWPPVEGDVWKDPEGARWFCRGERGKAWLVPMQARRDARHPDDVLGESGPLQLAYREGWSPTPVPAADVEPAGPVDKRAETIAGLHELADWLAANPDVPVFGSESFQVFPQNFPHIATEGEAVAELRRIAALVGVEPTQSRHASISVGFRGGISYGAVVCDVQLADHEPQDVAQDIAQAGEVAGPDSPQAGPATAADDGPLPRLVEPAPITDPALTVPVPVDHYHSGGAVGGPGENEAECACGTTFAGFDTNAEAVAALNAHIADPDGPVQDWWFTFGSGQKYDGRYVVINGTFDGAREEMFARFGNAWSMHYSSAERAGIEEFDLIVLPPALWPPRADEPTDPALGG